MPFTISTLIAQQVTDKCMNRVWKKVWALPSIPPSKDYQGKSI